MRGRQFGGGRRLDYWVSRWLDYWVSRWLDYWVSRWLDYWVISHRLNPIRG
jgi:hypothetical protein